MRHIHISSKGPRTLDNLFELGQYRDLIWLFTKRSFVVTYKQTILGPLWLLLNPFLTSLIHLIIFGGIAKLGTNGIPRLLFYLSGNALWNYFASCLTKNAGVFRDNSHLFGKVYFPRLIMPISNILGSLLQFLIQLSPALILLMYYYITGTVKPDIYIILLIPIILVQITLLGAGVGLIVSSLTVRYRDLSVLVTFGVSLLMYATPVVYPLSDVSDALKPIILTNPLTASFELFRLGLFGAGDVNVFSVILSFASSIVFSLLGIMVFSRVEKTFIDTI